MPKAKIKYGLDIERFGTVFRITPDRRERVEFRISKFAQFACAFFCLESHNTTAQVGNISAIERGRLSHLFSDIDSVVIKGTVFNILEINCRSLPGR